MREFLPKEAKTLPRNARRVFKGEIFDVYQWSQKMFDGTTQTFEMLKRQDTVEIMALLNPEEQRQLADGWRKNGIQVVEPLRVSKEEMKILVTYQTQPHQNWFYAYPGGRVDETDENELAAAKRELQEESGIACKSWKLLEAHQPFAKADWLVYTFLTTGLEQIGEQCLDGGEKITPLILSYQELKEYAQKPNAKFLWPNWLDTVNSFEELADLPGIFTYS